ncbi:PEGA domain-containing protein, partial [bacterium]|nr:PEGA domain-containing protein [bacterium]
LYRCNEEKKQFPTALSVFIASEVCKGLDYAHRKADEKNQPLNIVHRDISPQNILISYEGEVKIVDFGIAKAAMNISHTMAGILKGKIAFMSPEQALGKNVDHRTDIFSLGIILYEMLTGERLFSGESQFEVLKKIRTTRITAAKLSKDIPEQLREVLAKALAYNPDERYQSAGDMQIDLTKHLYSAHLDFTPRELAAFVKGLFAKEIKNAQNKSLKEAAITAQTNSIDFAKQAAMQENIVHRREDATARFPDQDMATQAIPLSGEDVTSATVSQRQKSLLRRVVVTSVIAAAVISGGAYIYDKVAGQKIAPAPVPTEISTVGTINITTEPDGAAITIDSQKTNLSTPAIVENLDISKTHTLLLEKEGYVTLEKKIEIKSTEPMDLSYKLEEKTGSLHVSSEPGGAAIFLNGQATGKATPEILDKLLLNADHKITLALNDYDDFEQVINLSTDKPQKLSAVLKKAAAMGSITVHSEPSDAEIFLNGKETGLKTPVVIGDLRINRKYTIRLVKDNYLEWTKTITLDTTEQKAVAATLDKEAEHGTLNVTSSPSGSAIFLNGSNTGKKTPATLTKLNRGATYSIGLKMDGYSNWSFNKKIEKPVNNLNAVLGTGTSQGATTTTPATKPSEPRLTQDSQEISDDSQYTGELGTLKVRSHPSKAEVYINSEKVGTTPLETKVPTGMITVHLRNEDRIDWTKKVLIEPNKLKDLGAISMGKLYGQITVASSPSNATVYLDGSPIPAKTPVTVRKVTRDRDHTLRVELPGYKPWTSTFNMKDTKHKKFQVILE